jgi:hypothetical protein
VVVERAEDLFTGTPVGPIAAFYSPGMEPRVVIEHGKVTPDHLLHEFAHHLDLSCRLGRGRLGNDFRAAQGIEAGAPWMEGETWSVVPAEIFAEAAAAVLGVPPSIQITPAALEVVRTADPRLPRHPPRPAGCVVGGGPDMRLPCVS